MMLYCYARANNTAGKDSYHNTPRIMKYKLSLKHETMPIFLFLSQLTWVISYAGNWPKFVAGYLFSLGRAPLNDFSILSSSDSEGNMTNSSNCNVDKHQPIKLGILIKLSL